MERRTTMLEPHAPEVRQELAAARLAALHRSAASAHPGPLRRAAGSALVRLGLRLGYDGSVPPLVAQPVNSVGVGLQSDTHTVFSVSLATESDLERELAAPFGIRVARLRT
jgi:hypothetical protein